MPARVGCNGPYHLEGSPHFPFLPELCSEATKQTTFRYRKCSLPCAGAPYADFPFIRLQSIFRSGLKNPWRYFIRLNSQRPKVIHSNLTEGRNRWCAHFFKATCALLKGFPMRECWAFTKSGGFPWSPARSRLIHSYFKRNSTHCYLHDTDAHSVMKGVRGSNH